MIVCSECGASITDSNVEKHAEWHTHLNELLHRTASILTRLSGNMLRIAEKVINR